MNKKLFLVILALSAMLAAGCDGLGDDDTILTTAAEQFFTLKPVGTISGKVVDRHTEKPVNGAIVSIAFNGAVTNATTDKSGSFSFANVPCNTDATTGTVTGTYQLTVSLVEVNKAIPDSLPKYREYYFNSTLGVTFIDLAKNDTSKNKVPAEGLEAHIWFDVAKLNTTINGSVVDENYDPVANATVWLREALPSGDVLQQTTTDASGNYSFTKVEDGTSVFVHAKSSDGTLEGTGAAMTLVINRALENLRPQVTAERVMITAADDVNPYVVSISPENLKDASPNNLKIVYRFSEPIKQTPYTDTTAPLGLGTLIDDIQFNFIRLKKAASGNTNFTLSWDATFSTLTITPAPSQIVGSAKYQVNVAVALGKLTDRAGNNVAPMAIIGDFEALNFSTNGGTILPGAPEVIRRLNANIGYDPLNFAGGTVGLEWKVDANARSYRVYRSRNGEPFVLLADDVLDTRFDDNSDALVTGYNPPGDRDPYMAISVRYIVRGVSKDLVEGQESNIITVKDDVEPRFVSAFVDSSTAGFDYLYLRFDEPLTITAAQTLGTSSYQIFNSGGGLNSTISEPVYLGYDNISGRYIVRLTITDSSIDVGDVVTVGSAVTDLANNPVDDANNNFTF